MSGKMTFHVPKRTWISVRHITVSLVLVCSQQHKLKRQCDMKNEDITLYTNEVEQLASHPWESNWTITEMRRTHCFSDSVNIHVLLPSCLLTTNNFMFEFFAGLVMPKHISEHRMHSLCRPNISPWGILNGLWLVCGSWFLCCVSHCITLSFASSLQLHGGVVSRSCLSSLVYRLRLCGLREQKLHLWRSSCDREAWWSFVKSAFCLCLPQRSQLR